MNLHPHHGATPEVHPSAWVAPNAHLIGDVFVDEGASIWFGAVLRADVCTISVGKHSNVQDNSVFHADWPYDDRPCTPTIIGDRVTVGHACVLHGCTLADEVLVGMGAVIMNRSRLESGCIVGARALVAEDKHIPARSLVVGIPGKILRPTSDAEAAGIVRSSNTYYRLSRMYRGETTDMGTWGPSGRH